MEQPGLHLEELLGRAVALYEREFDRPALQDRIAEAGRDHDAVGPLGLELGLGRRVLELDVITLFPELVHEERRQFVVIQIDHRNPRGLRAAPAHGAAKDVSHHERHGEQPQEGHPVFGYPFQVTNGYAQHLHFRRPPARRLLNRQKPSKLPNTPRATNPATGPTSSASGLARATPWRARTAQRLGV